MHIKTWNTSENLTWNKSEKKAPKSGKVYPYYFVCYTYETLILHRRSKPCLLISRFVFRTFVGKKGQSEMQVTGDELIGTTGKRKSLSHRPLRANSHREREV